MYIVYVTLTVGINNSNKGGNKSKKKRCMCTLRQQGPFLVLIDDFPIRALFQHLRTRLSKF